MRCDFLFSKIKSMDNDIVFSKRFQPPQSHALILPVSRTNHRNGTSSMPPDDRSATKLEHNLHHPLNQYLPRPPLQPRSIAFPNQYTQPPPSLPPPRPQFPPYPPSHSSPKP